MVTPGIMIAPPPIHTLSPMITGAVLVLQNEFKGTIWLRLPKAFSGICGVEGSVNLDIRCNQGIIADHNFVVVQKGAIHVDLAVVAKVNVVSVVNIKKSCDPQIFASPAEQFAEDAVFFCQIFRIGIVVIPGQIFCFVPLGQKFFVAAVIQLSCQHFFPFGHVISS